MAGIDEKDILYISPSNEALAHLPYMIALDRSGHTLLSCCEQVNHAPAVAAPLIFLTSIAVLSL